MPEIQSIDESSSIFLSIVLREAAITISSFQNLDNIEETLSERLIGLTEMFPESVRDSTSAAASRMLIGAKWLYNFTGKTIWIVSTSFVILALPVIFEVERVQTEEAQLQQQRQILLGPGSTGSGMGLPLGYPQPQRK